LGIVDILQVILIAIVFMFIFFMVLHPVLDQGQIIKAKKKKTNSYEKRNFL